MKRIILKTLLWVVPIIIWSSYGFAASVMNVHTGADSVNSSVITATDSTNVRVTNNAIVNNNVSVNADTGHNSASGNTGNGNVKSGDICGSIDISNRFNQTKISSSNPTFALATITTATNKDTGYGSTNDAKLEVGTSNKIKVDNDLKLVNKVNLDPNTGGNSADFNTGNGSVRSGDIHFTIDIDNVGNLVDISFGKGGGAILPEEPDQPTNFGKGGGATFAAATTTAQTLPVAGSENIIFALLSAALITFLALLMTDKKLKNSFIGLLQ